MNDCVNTKNVRSEYYLWKERGAPRPEPDAKAWSALALSDRIAVPGVHVPSENSFAAALHFVAILHPVDDSVSTLSATCAFVGVPS
ncbi:hypothetical protein [Rhizobium sp. MHM7A]|uniref:hypothetical protein n=1 Tax=Rhizobium sp. MHM7A TaxID=2583233 RepID=UPI001106DE93|nr:hypothetical protein [Rhizobium sp. MHM7A]TLX16104.1 hypothetical protein FFR93_01920 [Rhizobium sp. MHM7A]